MHDGSGISSGGVPTASARREKRGMPWGRWILASGPWGCGATCNDHKDSSKPTKVCKKQVGYGRSGLTEAQLLLRLKRWLLVGLDDADWDGDELATHHITMGGVHMRDFAEGFSEAECDAIATSTM